MRLCLLLAICPVIFAQRVTDTKLVNAGKGEEMLRKINGRWWSQDNREVYEPSKGGVFWELDSKPGVVQFFHHRPFQLDRAESLHLWMKKEEVQAALGPPNRIFGADGHGWFYYYASNGIKLDVRFMDGVLGEAKYSALGGKNWPVASIESELAGRSIYKLMAERAGKKSEEWLAQKQEENRIQVAARSDALRKGIRPAGSRGSSQASVVAVEAMNAQPQPPARKQIISAEALATIALGATREDVVSRLGEPSAKYGITGDDGARESFTYDLDSGEAVVIRLVDGKVVKVR
jgi:hypothetical protein